MKRSGKLLPFYKFLGFFLLFFLILFGGYKVYKWLFSSPFWSLKRTNLLFINKDNLAVFSFENKNSFLVEFPLKEKVLLPRGFGEYELGKVFSLGELENKGPELAIETLQNFYEIPLFGYFQSDNFNAENANSPKYFGKIIFQALRGNLKTNLNKNDIILIYLKGKKLPKLFFEKIAFNTSQSNDMFKDEIIRNEALAVEILNGTEFSGMAQKTALFWEKMGGRVARVADSLEIEKKNCKLIVRPEAQKSYSLKILKHFFDCDLNYLEEENPRFDISLILGEGYWEKTGGKW
jgi:hypothetical protein